MVLFRKFIWIVASRLLAAVLQAVTLILIARSAGPSQFGLLSAFMGIVVIIQVISDCGIAPYVTRLRATSPDASFIGVALKVHRFLGILACAMLLGVAVIFSFIGNQGWWSLIPLAIAGYFERQGDVKLTLAIADGDVWKNAFNLILRRLITFLVVIIGTYANLQPILVFGMGSLAGSYVSFWISRRLVAFQRHPRAVGRVEVRDVLTESSPFWINSIGAQLRNFDAFLVATLTTPAIAGYYGVISRSLNPLMMISSSLATVLLPLASRAEGKVGRALTVPVGIVFGLVVSLYLTLAYHAENVVFILFGSEFLPASSGFRVVLVGLIFASLSALLSSFLQAHGAARCVGRVSIVTSIISLIGISIGVILAGILGAAVGLGTAYVIQSICLVTVAVMIARGRGIK